MTLTINDIAKKAKVSKSTVSRVLNNSGYVRKETREKIENVIKENIYYPSATARSLSKKESSTIGVIIPEADNEFFGEVLTGISEIVDEHNMTLIFCDTSNNFLKEERALAMLNMQRVKGLILTPVNDHNYGEAEKKLKQKLKDLKIPIVLLDRGVKNSEWDGVYFENYKSAYSATEILIKEGHKKIGIITGDLKLKIGQDRYKGYLGAMEDYGMEIINEYIYEGNFSVEKAYELSKQFIESKDLPDAIITCNNRTTLGFIKALKEYNLTLGKDIAAIGIDSNKVLDILGYNFSYVARDAVEMGRVAMHRLLERFEDPNKQRVECIMPYKIYLKGSEKMNP
ncbi:LacI family transcriptional regulator [Anaerosolibacter carboniphilus]|uniref:LacI family transcriptional regulator n=1 Tax=Anaerosolibacter carboniphilus TaxID=1417629 RepID=A0A841KM18_9FIRM|nr:LacI family DNA-binding transcriptional regulator [Anaerosolibacter carboniphilus]MBB6214291.1 LacI family transcriptional regulator [Anaerosolibacter carboniphilus]